MFVVDFVSRILHVLTAITLVGGSIFTLLVLMPSVKELSEEAHGRLHTAVVGRWKRFVHGGVLLFLATGLYNYIRAVPSHKGDNLYHILVLTKVTLAMGVFFLAAAMVGRSPKLEPIRKHKAKWMKVLVALALVIVSISGFVKVRGPMPIDTTTNNTTLNIDASK